MSLAGYAESAVILLKTAETEALANAVAEVEAEVADPVVEEVTLTREDSGKAEEEEADTKTPDMDPGVTRNQHMTHSLLTIKIRVSKHMLNISALNSL